ncbi:MAG TPA: DNA gyrase inhibitor YacG [Propylenella sp.]|nr:DNA gyrase inhibitor YacG [Propylenella sp.]
MTERASDAAAHRRRNCPICGRPATAEAFPFCSKRCADVDLNRWLKGTYAIPTAEAPGGREPDEE